MSAARIFPLLIRHFLGLVARELKVPVRAIGAAAHEKLARYTYPGNVRELRNLIERACILAAGTELGPDDFLLPPSPANGDASEPTAAGEPREAWVASLPESLDLRSTLESVEAELIVRALAVADGVQAEAARRLGLSRSDLAYKLKKYAIEAERLP